MNARSTYVDTQEFASLIIKFIGSEDYERILDSMHYNTNEFEQGFMQGLAWSSILMTQCAKYFINTGEY